MPPCSRRGCAKEPEPARPRDDRAELERRGRAARRTEIDALQHRAERARERPAADQGRARSGWRRSSGRGRPALGGARRPRATARRSSRRQISECESRLVALAATELPLCLVDDLLERSSGRTSGSERPPRPRVIQRPARRAGRAAARPCSPRRRPPPDIVRKVKSYLDARSGIARHRRAEDVIASAIAHGERPVAPPPPAADRGWRSCGAKPTTPARATRAARSRSTRTSNAT